MESTSFSNQLMNNLSFPFKDRDWLKKAAIGAGLSLASFIIPILPTLFVYGYSLRMMRRIISGDGKPALPEWDDWGKLLSDGLKLWGAAILYSLPVILLMLVAVVGMLVAFISPVFMIRSDGSLPPQAGVLTIVGFLVFMVLMAVIGVLGWVVNLAEAPALSHLAAKDSFEAAFRIGEWWPILKKGIGGFLLAIVLVAALSFVSTLVIQMLMLTIILAFLMPFLAGIYIFFLLIYINTWYALAYRDSVRKLASAA